MASPRPFQPLVFTLTGDNVELAEDGALATSHGMNPLPGGHSAVCGDAPMVAGRHFVEVTMVTGDYIWAVGVVGADFDPAAGGLAQPLGHGPDGGPLPTGCGAHPQGWMYCGYDYGSGYQDQYVHTGNLIHAGNYSQRWAAGIDFQGLHNGDRVGLLLDLGAGSLAVFRNGERLGLMVREGIVPPVCWAVDLIGGGHGPQASARLESQPAPEMEPEPEPESEPEPEPEPEVQLSTQELSRQGSRQQADALLSRTWVKQELYELQSITRVQEIDSPPLKSAYDAYLASLPDSEDQLVFHGCPEDALTSIATGGFKKEFWKSSAGDWQRFGPGFYFAMEASKAHEYPLEAMDALAPGEHSRAMVMCKVAKGRVYRATVDMDDLNGAAPDGYHSVHGIASEHGTLNYDELVVYEEAAVLPVAIVTYRFVKKEPKAGQTTEIAGFGEAYILKVAEKGDAALAQVLAAGADINRIYTFHSGRKMTALQCAAAANKAAALQVLTAAGAQGDQDALTYAAEHGAAEVVHSLVSAGYDVNAQREFDDKGRSDGATPLIAALRTGPSSTQEDVAKALLKAGAASGCRLVDRDGRSALYCAARRGYSQIAQELIDAGSDLNALGGTEYDSSPLITAAYDGHTEIVRALVQAKADVWLRTNDGKTALHLALQRNKDEASNVLYEAAGAVTLEEKGSARELMSSQFEAWCEEIAALRAQFKQGAHAKTAEGEVGVVGAFDPRNAADLHQIARPYCNKVQLHWSNGSESKHIKVDMLSECSEAEVAEYEVELAPWSEKMAVLRAQFKKGTHAKTTKGDVGVVTNDATIEGELVWRVSTTCLRAYNSPDMDDIHPISDHSGNLSDGSLHVALEETEQWIRIGEGKWLPKKILGPKELLPRIRANEVQLRRANGSESDRIKVDTLLECSEAELAEYEAAPWVKMAALRAQFKKGTHAKTAGGDVAVVLNDARAVNPRPGPRPSRLLANAVELQLADGSVIPTPDGLIRQGIMVDTLSECSEAEVAKYEADVARCIDATTW